MTPGFLPLLLFCGDIELEVEDVTVLDHIRLSFLPVFASFFHTGHASLATAELFEILECDGFGFNEPTLEVRVNNAGSLWRKTATVHRPSSHLVCVYVRGARASNVNNSHKACATQKTSTSAVIPPCHRK